MPVAQRVRISPQPGFRRPGVSNDWARARPEPRPEIIPAIASQRVTDPAVPPNKSPDSTFCPRSGRLVCRPGCPAIPWAASSSIAAPCPSKNRRAARDRPFPRQPDRRRHLRSMMPATIRMRTREMHLPQPPPVFVCDCCNDRRDSIADRVGRVARPAWGLMSLHGTKYWTCA